MREWSGSPAAMNSRLVRVSTVVIILSGSSTKSQGGRPTWLGAWWQLAQSFFRMSMLQAAFATHGSVVVVPSGKLMGGVSTMTGNGAPEPASGSVGGAGWAPDFRAAPLSTV